MLASFREANRTQNALARVVACQHTNVSPSSTPLALLKQLHWLPTEWRIWFKLATVTFKTFHTNHPPYFADLVQYYQRFQCLCTTNSGRIFGAIQTRLCQLHYVWNVSI